MEKFGSVDALLDFAIEKEQEAADFYASLAGKMDKPWMREVFEDFAREETKHRDKLVAVKEGQFLVPAQDKIVDLKIAEYVTEKAPSADMEYQEALILAMKREKAAFKLYTDLAEITDDENVKNTMLALAQEEAKHKLWVETEYDKVVLTDN